MRPVNRLQLFHGNYQTPTTIKSDRGSIWMQFSTHFFPRSLELYDRKQCFRGHLWRKNKSFQKKPMFLVVEKSQIESSWMVLTAESWEHSGKFCQNIIIFWQNISLCSQISANSTIQRDSIWLFWTTQKRGLFMKWFVFPPQMPSEALFSVI